MFNQHVRRIAARELSQFFASPAGALFLAGFVLITLYIFFWVETFFARNIADVRPLFQWMPILLIFLAATLTMRVWSEERRSGTIEYVMTLPVNPYYFVLGKFYACFILLLIAIVITLPLPITVSIIADLDWGPVVAGYLATLLLGSAYLSIGLYISVKTDNQIISLILTVLVCGLFNLAGSPLLTEFFSNDVADIFRLFGSGSRFESIQRGVIDFRDLYYYISITLMFMVLSVYALDKQRWAKHIKQSGQRRMRWGSYLLVLNILLVNVWLLPLNMLRLDATKGQIYSLSDASRQYLSSLQEPLLLRGYFSAKTHPLLAPLVPQLKDMLREYAIASGGQVRVEFIDPVLSPEKEDEANKKYGIKPVPLQITDKYQASLVNSYFNILVKYGDQFQVLGFRDLIEVKARGETDMDVRLRNPEYDISRSIKKVLVTYQSGGNLFNQISSPVKVTAYISEDKRLPKILVKLKSDINKHLTTTKTRANKKLIFEFISPEKNNITEKLRTQYGLKPMAANIKATTTFYFYVLMSNGKTTVQIALPSDYKIDEFKRNFDAGIKRFAHGFLKTAGVVDSGANPYLVKMGMASESYVKLKKALSANLNVKKVDLKKGIVPGDIDVLFLASPDNLGENELFAIDQYLMQGGTLIIATSPYAVELKNNKLVVKSRKSGLEKWLQHHGIRINNSFVMDEQNTAFPVPVTRTAEGYSFQELRMLDYPFFIDLRKGLSQSNAITADLGQLTMAWVSPIELNKNLGQRKVIRLLTSSDKSWEYKSIDVMPRLRLDGKKPFPSGGEQGSRLLGMIMSGEFSSYFKDQPVPEILTGKTDMLKKKKTVNKQSAQMIRGSIMKSSDTARIILFSSNEFIQDQTVRLLSSAHGSSYLNAYQLMANTIDWSLEDRGLLSIRSRGHFNKTIPPMERDEQVFWEYLNYILGFAGVVMVMVIRRIMVLRKIRRYRHVIQEG